MIKYTWSEFEFDVSKLANWVRSLEAIPANIYGIPRGGINVAIALSALLDIPMVERNKIKVGQTLIVDDLVDSGKTIRPFFQNKFLTATIHAKDGAKCYPDHYISYMPKEWIEYPWEEGETPAEDAVIRLLQALNEDPAREGLRETPKRYMKALQYLTSGYRYNPKDIIKTFSPDGYDEMVLLKDVEMYSLCEHHLLPFFGKAHIAYIPDRKIIGISKLARLVDIFSKRLQIQERIGDQITETLMTELEPKGAACIIEAGHLCMRMRGVQKQNSTMVTSSLKGVFLTDQKARKELMDLIR